jgi:hypothetical protein
LVNAHAGTEEIDLAVCPDRPRLWLRMGAILSEKVMAESKSLLWVKKKKK